MDSTISSAIESSAVKSEMSATTEAEAERSSRWMFVASIAIFCLITCFCFGIFLFTMAISVDEERTMIDKDPDLGGGNEDKQTTTQKPIVIDMSTVPPREQPVTSPTSTETSTAPAPTTTTLVTTATLATTSPSTTTSTQATTSTLRTTTTTAVPEAEKAPRGTVVCTVSNQVPPGKSAYPADGVCDLLFFDSFYKDNKNVLANGYNSLLSNAVYFLMHASTARQTQWGISLAFTNTTSKADFLTEKFYSAVINISSFNVIHYGFLNLYREFSTPTVVTDALLVLKALYFRVKNNRSFYVLGLSIDFAENDTTVDLMRTIFVPSMFIAIGHVSYSDASFPDCTILPPSIRWFPISRRTNRTYGHKMNDTLAILDLVRKSHPHLPLSVSVGLSGRNYAPKLVEDIQDHYFVFRSCKDFPGPYFEDPANVCPSVAGQDWESVDSTFYQYKSLINAKLKRTFTFDIDVTIKAKVCDIKRNLLNVSFGVAAYDIDYDSNPRGCLELEIQPGGFKRLSAVRSLSNFLNQNYTGHFDCLVS